LDTFANIAPGCSISPQPMCLPFCFIGVAPGAIVGILPGLGSAATIARLLPITYFLDTATAIIMLSGIWYGSMYGGSITSILLRANPLPENAVMALTPGAFMGHGVTPGPTPMIQHPEMFWAIVTSMFVGNCRYARSG